MTHKLSIKNVAILAQSPLIRMGMAEFVRELKLGYRCVLSTSSFLYLPKKMLKAAVKTLIVEVSGNQEIIQSRIRQLLILNEKHPELNVVVYISCQHVEFLLPLLANKKFSLLAQQESNEQIRRDMPQALEGHQVCSPKIKKSVELVKKTRLLGFNTLTNSESSVLMHLFSGMSLQDIATLHNRSVKTISAHKRNCMRKLRVNNDADFFLMLNILYPRFLKNRVLVMGQEQFNRRTNCM